MSDDATSERAGSLSPRNVDTVTYRVVRELPVPGIAPVGGTFTAWAQGEAWASVSGLGMGAVMNGDIASWLESGLIVRETPLTPSQERARMQEAASARAPGRESGSGPSGATAAALRVGETQTGE